MPKSYREMTASERTADRIAKNMEIERKSKLSPGYWTVDRIASLLNERKQRATYGAVAEMTGGIAQSVTKGRPKNALYSWIVAKNGAPTGYLAQETHPDCLRQTQEGENNIITDGEELRRWLGD